MNTVFDDYHPALPDPERVAVHRKLLELEFNLEIAHLNGEMYAQESPEES